MVKDITVFNIREFLHIDSELGEKLLDDILSDFFCYKNPDVERFLREQSIEFTKKNQSVTYLVFSNEDAVLVGYFTLAIKPIHVSAETFSNRLNRRISRVSVLDEKTNTFSMSAYLIAQLGKNLAEENRITGEQLLQAAIETIKALQYMAGGMVVFLEAENNEKLLDFYEKQNGFKRFDTRATKGGKEEEQMLVQLLKVL